MSRGTALQTCLSNTAGHDRTAAIDQVAYLRAAGGSTGFDKTLVVAGCSYGRLLLVLTVCLTFAAGCSRTPAKPPTSPQPPRPQMSSDGQLKSLLGNAVLSNALLSFKMQCSARTTGVRICTVPPEAAPRAAAGST